MAEIIRPAHMEYMSDQTLEYRFHKEPNSGFSFGWKNGKPILAPEAKENYEWCRQHPEEVECLGVIKRRWAYKEPAVARCECGEEIVLIDEYYGCCQCPHCGRWHAISGYQVNPPDAWTEEMDPD